ncbi:hypothetical protein JCM10213_006523 [Rhodosporidiobolus nylandii]
MDGRAGRRVFPRHLSPSSSIVPDSQSPEPPRQPPPQAPASSSRDPSSGSSASEVFRTPALPPRRFPPPASTVKTEDDDVKPFLPISRHASVVSTAFSEVSTVYEPQVKLEDEDDVKPKEEDLEVGSTSEVNSARGTPLRYRSTAPELEGDEKPAIKPEEEDADTGSRSSDERRRRETAPSLTPAPKKEEKAEYDSTFSVSETPQPEQAKQRSLSPRASEEPRLVVHRGSDALFDGEAWQEQQEYGGGYAGYELSRSPTVQPSERASLFLDPEEDDRGASPSPSQTPGFEVDELMSEQDEQDEEVDELEATPFEIESSEEEEGSVHDEAPKRRTTRKRKVVVAQEKQRKKQKRSRGEDEDNADVDFLDSLDIEPSFPTTKSSLKARLNNELAEGTRELFADHQVQSIPVPTPPCVPTPPKTPDDTPAPQQQTAPAGPAPSIAMDLLDEDELPDYEEEQEPPEVVLGGKKDTNLVLAGEQTYWTNPTKKEAVARWAAMMEKDAVQLKDVPPKKDRSGSFLEPIPYRYSFEQYTSDRAHLLNLRPPLPPDALKLVQEAEHRLLPSFSLLQRDSPSAFAALLSSRPSTATLRSLFSDILSPRHKAKHDASAGHGRSCFCPLWVPEQRKSWEEEVEQLEESGIDIEDLQAVLVGVFDLTDEKLAALSAELGARALSGKELLELIHTANWLWFEQIVELASIHLFYAALCETSLVLALNLHREARMIVCTTELARLEKACEKAEVAANRGDPAAMSFVASTNGTLQMEKGKWKAEDVDLSALIARLSGFSPSPPGKERPLLPPPSTTHPSQAAHPSRPAPTKAKRRHFDPPRSETPGAKMARVEGWVEGQPDKYHWGLGGRRTPCQD